MSSRDLSWAEGTKRMFYLTAQVHFSMYVLSDDFFIVSFLLFSSFEQTNHNLLFAYEKQREIFFYFHSQRRRKTLFTHSTLNSTQRNSKGFQF